MGFHMNLTRATLHGVSPRQAFAVDFFLETEDFHSQRHPGETFTTEDFRKKNFRSLEELDDNAVEALRAEYQPRYHPWDKEKKWGRKTIFEEAGYWKGKYPIHKWFVKNVQGGVDDGGIYAVSKEQLEKLKATCEAVLSGKRQVNRVLPSARDWAGIDEGYEEVMRDTIEIIDRILSETDWETQTICYCGS